MNDLNVRHWTGALGVATIALILLAQPLWVIGGPAPRLEETVQFSEYVSRNNMVILTRSLVDTLIIACFLIFLAGLRYLIRQGKTDGELVSTLVFGVGLVFAMLTLFGDALCTGAALDTVGGKAEPVVGGQYSRFRCHGANHHGAVHGLNRVRYPDHEGASQVDWLAGLYRRYR